MTEREYLIVKNRVFLSCALEMVEGNKMTIEELGDILNVDLLVRRYANQGNRYTAKFEKTRVKENKESNIVSSDYGSSTTFEGAVLSYIKNIRGKWLVVDDCNFRREFGVPDTLSQ